MNPVERILDALGACGCKPKQRGKQWYAKCPVHGGNDFDSLSLAEGGDGRALVTCHSQGCAFGAVMQALGLEPQDAWPRSAEIGGTVVPLRRCPTETPPEPDVVYDYVDEDGQLLYQVCRYQRPDGKTFRQRRPDGNGGWTWSLGEVRRVLYRLPALLAAVSAGSTVFLVEGEKDVETLAALSLPATCCQGGAMEKPESWLPEWTEALRGAKVVILPDNDAPGKRHAAVLRQVLDGVAESIRVVELPGLGLKGDVSDWVQAGGTVDQLVRLCQQRRLVAVEFNELLAKKLPPKRTLLEPWLYSQDLVMVYAKRGVGKTMFLLELTLGLASGGKVFSWSCPSPVRVLYVDGEMPAVTMQERIAASVLGRSGKVKVQPLIVTPDLQEHGIRSLSTVEGRQDLLDILDDTTVLILDNLSCLYGGDENDSEAWDEMQAFLLKLRSRGITGIVVHHAGKSGQQRGTSRREDVLDTVIRLSRPQDYRAAEGARFLIDFEKARNLNGRDVESLDVQLTDLPDGSHEWSYMSGDESQLRQIADLVQLGMTQREIAVELGISKGSLCRRFKQARERGLIS